METMDWAGRKPLVIARGGASDAAPEHTIAAFEAAIGDGADAIGLRVRLTRDGHPVVFGPPMLQGTTNGHGSLSAHTMRDLKRLDAGSWKDPRFAGQRIQTLQEVLERFRDRTRFWIELPEGGGEPGSIEERVVSTIEIYEAVELCQVYSTDLGTLDRVRALNQEVKLAARWTTGQLGCALQTARALDAVCASAEGLGAADVEAIRAAGLGCYVETADEPALVDRLVGWRVNGVFTGCPGLARARIDRSEPCS
jgi:glycerophosphoryl diester phosphodiesterase